MALLRDCLYIDVLKTKQLFQPNLREPGLYLTKYLIKLFFSQLGLGVNGQSRAVFFQKISPFKCQITCIFGGYC